MTHWYRNYQTLMEGFQTIADRFEDYVSRAINKGFQDFEDDEHLVLVAKKTYDPRVQADYVDGKLDTLTFSDGSVYDAKDSSTR